MDMCDEMGIVVIDECPAVGLESFNDVVLALHKQSLIELVSFNSRNLSIFLENAPTTVSRKGSVESNRDQKFSRDFRFPGTRIDLQFSCGP